MLIIQLYIIVQAVLTLADITEVGQYTMQERARLNVVNLALPSFISEMNNLLLVTKRVSFQQY